MTRDEMLNRLPEPFRPFWGNNTEEVPQSRITRGGFVSFADHLGFPPSHALWRDLTERFHIKVLRVYHPSQSRWTDGVIRKPAVIIDLDEDLNVVDIHIAP
jgi:hypothetical protein